MSTSEAIEIDMYTGATSTTTTTLAESHETKTITMKSWIILKVHDTQQASTCSWSLLVADIPSLQSNKTIIVWYNVSTSISSSYRIMTSYSCTLRSTCYEIERCCSILPSRTTSNLSIILLHGGSFILQTTIVISMW